MVPRHQYFSLFYWLWLDKRCKLSRYDVSNKLILPGKYTNVNSDVLPMSLHDYPLTKVFPSAVWSVTKYVGDVVYDMTFSLFRQERVKGMRKV